MTSWHDLNKLKKDALTSIAFAWFIDAMLYKSWLKVADGKILACEDRIGNDVY